MDILSFSWDNDMNVTQCFPYQNESYDSTMSYKLHEKYLTFFFSLQHFFSLYSHWHTCKIKFYYVYKKISCYILLVITSFFYSLISTSQLLAFSLFHSSWVFNPRHFSYSWHQWTPSSQTYWMLLSFFPFLIFEQYLGEVVIISLSLTYFLHLASMSLQILISGNTFLSPFILSPSFFVFIILRSWESVIKSHHSLSLFISYSHENI